MQKPHLNQKITINSFYKEVGLYHKEIALCQTRKATVRYLAIIVLPLLNEWQMPKISVRFGTRKIWFES